MSCVIILSYKMETFYLLVIKIQFRLVIGPKEALLKVTKMYTETRKKKIGEFTDNMTACRFGRAKTLEKRNSETTKSFKRIKLIEPPGI